MTCLGTSLNDRRVPTAASHSEARNRMQRTAPFVFLGSRFVCNQGPETTHATEYIKHFHSEMREFAEAMAKTVCAWRTIDVEAKGYAAHHTRARVRRARSRDVGSDSRRGVALARSAQDLLGAPQRQDSSDASSF